MSVQVQTRTRKRAREDSGPAPEEPRQGPELIKEEDKPPLEKDTEFWFDDGTVILAAGGVEFRVYGGVLANKSPILKKLFSHPHPTRVVSMNGQQDMACPVVTLSDSPHDLRHILRIFFTQDDFGSYAAKSPSFHVVSARMRLGRKYQIASLYERALQFLKTYYTDKWEVASKLESWVPPGWSDSHAIGVVNLSRLVSEPSILPFALMACGAAGPKSLIRGFAREDGSREFLVADDLVRCLAGKEKLRKASVAALYSTLAPVADATCKRPEECKGLLRTATLALSSKIDKWMDEDPFAPVDYVVGDIALCDPCSAALIERNWGEHSALWRRLPELFDVEVPGWSAKDAPDNAASNVST